MKLSDLNRVLAPIRNRLSNMLARAVVQLVDDGEGLQIVQLGVLDGETRGDLERLQNYGFTSRPKSGAEAAVLFVGGHRDHGLVVAVDDRRYRVKGLKSGEVAVYSEFGSKIHLKEDGSIELTPGANGKIVLAGGGAEVARKGDGTSSGTLSFASNVLTWTPRLGAPIAIGTIAGQAVVTPGTPAQIDGEVVEGAEKVTA